MSRTRVGTRISLRAQAVEAVCALLVYGLATFAVPTAARSQCTLDGPSETALLAAVVDGDTLRLTDSRTVRLIGVNTPELGHGHRPDERGAREAREFAEVFLGATRTLRIVPGEDPRDRHGRVLAHVYREDGASLEAALLAAGLALRVVVPPNLGQTSCLADAERLARERGIGSWGSGAFRPLPTKTLGAGESGFRFLRGRVSRVSRSRSSWWVEVDDRVALRIAREDQPFFAWTALRALEGREVEFRGWIVWRGEELPRGHKSWLMPLHHPAAIAPLRRGD